MNWFRGWSFSKKLMIVNAGYILPCAILVYFLIQDKNSQVQFSDKERLGVEYQRPLEGLLTHTSQYKVATLMLLGGKKEMAPKIDGLRSQIERDFAALEEVDSHAAVALRFTTTALAAQKREKAAASALKSQWQAFDDQREGLTVETASERGDKLIADLRLAINHAGDTSNLILDPDLDSYYLMDAVLLALPQALDRVQEIVTYVQSLSTATSSTLNLEQKIKLNVLATMLRADTDHLTSSVQTALNEDKNFQGVLPSMQRELPPALKIFTASTDKLLHAVQTLADNELSAENGEAAIALGDDSLDINLAFWSKAAEQLNLLLEVRIEAIQKARLIALAAAFLAWLPAVLLAALTVRGLNRSFISSVARLESEAAMANSSSAHLASTSQTVSSGSTEQAAAIQETGASMSQMASMVSRSSSQAVSSQELAHKVKEQTDAGCRVIERMVESMEAIQDANAQLQNISNIISDISGKTNIINDIVGKTQLLSFNASIEAARAGQHGRGFAVVAEEVGNLAQTSGNAAKEIRSLIEDSRVQVEHILKSTIDRVVEGRMVTEQAQEIFLKIAKDTALISTQIEGISEAAREQQFGIEQIAKAMTQMDETTQANNSAALNAAKLSDQLMSQSHKLSTIASTVAELVSGRPRVKRSDLTTAAPTSLPRPPSAAGPGQRDGAAASLGPSDQLVTTLLSRQHEMDHPGVVSAAAMDADDPTFLKAS